MNIRQLIVVAALAPVGLLGVGIAEAQTVTVPPPPTVVPPPTTVVPPRSTVVPPRSTIAPITTVPGRSTVVPRTRVPAGGDGLPVTGGDVLGLTALGAAALLSGLALRARAGRLSGEHKPRFRPAR